MNTDYLDKIEARFNNIFKHSHLIISFEKSIHYSGTTNQWTLAITFDELWLEDLEPKKIFEQFDNFKDLDDRLSFLMQREASSVEGIKEEIAG